MAHLTFTAQLQRFTATPELDVPAATLGEALDATFAVNPQLRGYLLDDQGKLRKHVAVFIDGQMISDRSHLQHPLTATSEVHVLQALSGG